MKSKLLYTILLCVSMAWSAFAQTQFWGTTTTGGPNNQGTIVMADYNGANFQVIYAFANSTGATPVGSLVLANNGKLYGVTEEGAFGNAGVLFSYDPYNGIYTLIRQFYLTPSQGWGAKSGMVKAIDGSLYGLCDTGGTNGLGVIYKVDPVTDTYTDIYHFASLTGGSPKGTLIQLSNGKLYGMTSTGGANSFGTIFSYDPLTDVYIDLYDFDGVTGGQPVYGGLVQANNSKLYGLTANGGANNMGVLFSFGISAGVYTDLFDFDGTNGANPYGSLVQANNGLLYGMTRDGGANTKGVIFSYSIANDSLGLVHEFQGQDGATPERSLVEANNVNLYGITNTGGSYNKGAAFYISTITGNYHKLADFSGATLGSYPNCDLIETPIITGIEETTAATFHDVYPNPSAGSITITGSDEDEIFQFTDLSGRELLSVKIIANSKTDLDVSGFPNVFFVKRENGEVSKMVRE